MITFATLQSSPHIMLLSTRFVAKLRVIRKHSYTCAFYSPEHPSIDELYVDGVSITLGINMFGHMLQD